MSVSSKAAALLFAAACALALVSVAHAQSNPFPNFGAEQSVGALGGAGLNFASSNASDLQCIPVIQQCSCGMIPNPNPNGPKCIGGPNKFMCPCVDPRGVTGKCIANTICQGTGYTGQNGQQGTPGMQQLGQALQQLMQQLMQAAKGGGGGGGGGGSSTPPPTAAGCVTMMPTSDPNAPASNPCLYYVPGTGGNGTLCTDATASNYGSSAACIYSSLCNDPLANNYGAAATCSYGSGNSSSTNPGGGSSGTDAISITDDQFTPKSLSVTAGQTVVWTNNGSMDHTVTADSGSFDSGTIAPGKTYSQTFTTPGTYPYHCQFHGGPGGQGMSGTVTVTAASGSSGASSSSGSSNSSAGVKDVLPGILAPGTALGSAATLLPGATTTGNIFLSGNGATIFEQSINPANNSEVAGFFGGSSTFGQPKSLVGQWCENRPWASNFLSVIIPPAFFDGLCSIGGYQVGPPPASTAPVVQVQQTSSQKPKPAATSTPVVSSVPPQVSISAVPPSVPLDGRTSIFWSSQGVSQCTETSPDGSFNENKLSGGAATVALAQATTFTISCLAPDGTTVTDNVTVNISI